MSSIARSGSGTQPRLEAAAAVLMWLLMVSVPAAAQPIPAVGAELQVNAFTTGDQVEPSVAVGPGGDFVVAWGSGGPPGGYPQYVLARRFDSAGVAQGEEFQVSFGTTDLDFEPDVAMDAEGDFVVVWTGAGIIPGYESILGRRYTFDGVSLGGFLANSFSIDRSRSPAVAMETDGSFVVVWDNDDSPGSDTDGRSVVARRFDSAGMPEGAEFQVNSYTTDDQIRPDVGVDGDGDFVIVWESDGAGMAMARSILAQRFASDGSAAGGEFRVSVSTLLDNSEPAVAVAEDGEFVVVWVGPGYLPGSDMLWGKRFASDGSQLDFFQVNVGTIGDLENPSLSIDADGSLFAVWSDGDSNGTDTDGWSIQGRYFAPSGTAVGSDFQVNAVTSGDQRRPAVAGDNGRFVVVWDGPGVDGDGLSVEGQRYGGGIFTDSFESGDATAWSP